MINLIKRIFEKYDLNNTDNGLMMDYSFLSEGFNKYIDELPINKKEELIIHLSMISAISDQIIKNLEIYLSKNTECANNKDEHEY